jgi:hypothetical protein
MAEKMGPRLGTGQILFGPLPNFETCEITGPLAESGINLFIREFAPLDLRAGWGYPDPNLRV